MSRSKLWRCTVCGFVHDGPEPPGACPVCGAPASAFETAPYGPAKAESARETGTAKAWRCRVCGYVHSGESPPDECPVCGAPANEFDEIARDTNAGGSAGLQPKRIIIAGGGIAGLSAAEAARESAPGSEIILLSLEDGLPYYRLNLTRFLAGEVGMEDLPIHPEEWYSDRRIELQTGLGLEKVRPADHLVELSNGSTMGYDKLIAATGADPHIPPVPGNDRPNVFTLRSLADARAILEAVEASMQVVIVGGGILGLETAGALARRGASVTILEASAHLMPRQLNAAGSDVLARHLYTLGIDVITHAKTERIEPATVELTDGSTVPADVVILTVGVRSNTGVFKEAGLVVNRALKVDNMLCTSDPDILAAGDACEHAGILYGSWAAAQYQGTIAGMNAAGMAAEFGGISRAHTLKILGKDMYSIGTISPTGEGFLILEDRVEEDYRMFILKNGILAGGLLIGDISLAAPLREAIENRRVIDSPAECAVVVRLLKAN